MRKTYILCLVALSPLAAGGCQVRSGKPAPLAQAIADQAARNAAAVVPNGQQQPDPVVLGLRKFPYPFHAMLAISSDADHQTLRKFNLIHRFLNTTEMTSYGRGLGLDVSDSFFMYNGSDLPVDIDYHHVPISGELTYFRGLTTSRYASDAIDRYIHCGWMDTIHTFGDFSLRNQDRTLFRRELALQALKVLRGQGDHVMVWVDHGNMSNVDNFGSYGLRPFFDYQQGANPQSPYYHTDQTIRYGIRFVWADQTNDVLGHDNVVYPLRLPDGQRVWGFWRYEGRTHATLAGRLSMPRAECLSIQ